jgi:hypothetical protein
LRILYEFTAFRVLTDVVFLVVVFFVQRFWFRGALQLIRRVSRCGSAKVCTAYGFSR